VQVNCRPSAYQGAAAARDSGKTVSFTFAKPMRCPRCAPEL